MAFNIPRQLFSFRWRLIVLVVLAILPAVGLILFAAAEDRANAKDDAEKDMLELGDLVNQSVTGTVARATTLLSTLAALNDIRTGSERDCAAVLGGLPPEVRAEYVDLYVAAPDGTVRCTAERVGPTDVSGIDAVKSALERREPTLGDYHVDPVSGKAVASLAYPIMDPLGELTGVVGLAFDLGFINQVSNISNLPEGSTLLVVDRNGAILVRLPAGSGAIGDTVPDREILTTVRAQGERGTLTNDGLDGTNRIYGYVPLSVDQPTRPFVVVGLPTSEVFAQSDDALQRNLIGLAIAVPLAIFAAWLIGDVLIGRRLKALAAGTRAVASGDLGVRVDEGGRDELSGLARSFNEMTAELALSRRQTVETEAQFRAVFESAQDGLVINDPETRTIVEANPAFCRMHGYEPGTMAGIDPLTFIVPADHQKFTAYIEAGRSGEVFRTRAIDVRLDGSQFPIDVTGTLFQFRGRRHLLAVCRDVTEQVETERLLEGRVAERTRQLSTLLDVARSVGSTLELRPLIGLILQQLKEVVDYTGAAVVTFDPDRASLTILEARFVGPHGLTVDNRASGLHIPFAPGNAIWRELEAGRAAIVDDVRESDHPFAHVYRETVGSRIDREFAFIRCWMGVPLIIKDRPIGMLTISRGEPGALDQGHADLAVAFAAQTAAALENARLFEQTDRRATETATLAEIAASFTLAGDLVATLEQIAAQVVGATEAVACDVTLLTPDGKLGISGAANLPAEWVERAREVTAAGAHSPIIAAARSQRTLTYTGLKESMRANAGWDSMARVLDNVEWDTVVVTPLIYHGHAVGALDTFYRPDEAPGEQATAFLQAIADQAAVGIENGRLFEQTRRKARENAALAAIAADVTIDQPVEVTLERIAEHVAAAVEGPFCTVYLYDARAGVFTVAGTYGVPPELRQNMLSLPDAPDSSRRRALIEGRPIVVPDLRARLEEHAGFGEGRRYLQGVEWRTSVSVPMNYRGEPVGVIVVAHERVFEPSDEDLAFFSAIGDEVAIAVSNMRLFEQADRKASENAALAAIAADVTIDQSVTTTIERIAHHVIDGAGPDTCGIYLYDAGTRQFTIAGAAGIPAHLIDPILSVPANEQSIRRQALESGKPVVVPDLLERLKGHDRYEALMPELQELGTVSTVDVPLIYRGEPVGVLLAGYNRRFEPTEEELSLLEAVGDEVAIAISNVQLYERTERRARENAALANIAANVTLDQPMQETLDGIAAGVLEATSAAGCAVMFVDGGGDGEPYTLRNGGGVGMPDGFMEIVARLPGGPRPFSPRMLESGQVSLVPRLRDAFAAEPAYAELVPLVEKANWGTGAVVPVIYRGRPVGVLNVAYTVGTEPGADERRTLMAIADQAAIAIENVRLFAETGRKVQANAALASIAANFTVGQPMREALDVVARNAVAAVPKAVACGVVLVDVETNRITLSGGAGLPPGMAEALAESIPATDTFSVEAIEQGRPLLVENARTRMLRNPTFIDVHKGLEDVPWENILIVPILFRSRPLGAINVGFRAGEAPDLEEEGVLRAIADQAAVAVENVRLYEQTDQRARENAALARVASTATLEQPFRGTLDGIAASVTAATRAKACAVYVVDEDAGSIEMAGGSGLPPGFVDAARALPPSVATLDVETLRQSAGKVTTVRNTRRRILTDPAYAPVRDFADVFPFDTVNIVPILYHGRALGALNVGYETGVEPGAEEFDILRAIADQAAVAIANARLFEQTERRVSELEALRGITQNITLVRPISSTLDALARSVISSTSAVACSLTLIDPDGPRIKLTAGHGLPAGFLDAIVQASETEGWREGARALLQSDEVVAVRDARTRILSDATFEPLRPFIGRVAWEDYWTVPLRFQGRRIGTLIAYYLAGDEPGEREIDFLRAIADQASVAVENARLFTEAEARAREQKAIASVAARLTYDRPLGEVLEAIAGDVVQGTRALACTIMLMTEGHVTAGQHGLPEGYLEAVQRARDDAPAFWDNFRVSDIEITENARETLAANPAYSAYRPFLAEVEWDTVVRVAFRHRDGASGLVVIYLEGGRPDDQETRFYRAIADQASGAIENARLFAQADLRAREQEAIASIAARLTYDRPVGEVLDAIAGDVVRGSRAVACAAFVMDHEHVTIGEFGLPPGYIEAVVAAHPVEFDRTLKGERVVTLDAREEIQRRPELATAWQYLDRINWDIIVRLPLTYGGQARGALVVYLPPGPEPAAEEMQLFGAIADQASAAVENARLFAEAQQRAQEQQTVASIAASLTYDKPLTEILEGVAAGIVRGTRALACSVSLIGDGEFVQDAQHGLPQGYLETRREGVRRFGVSPPERALLAGQPSVTNGVRDEIAKRDELAPLRQFFDEIEWDIIISVPMLYDGKPTGGLSVYLPPGPDPAEREVSYFQAIADQASVALVNAGLFAASEQQAREQATLASIAASLTFDRPLADVLDGLAENVVKGTRAMACTVVTLENGQPSQAGQFGLPGDYLRFNRRRIRRFGVSPAEAEVFAGQWNISNNMRHEIATRPDLEPLRPALPEIEWDVIARVPLTYDGEPRGALMVYLPPGPDPDEHEMRYYQAIADQASVAMENSRLFTESEQHAREQEAIASIAASLTYDRPLADVLVALANDVVRGSRATAASLIVLDRETQAVTTGNAGLPDGYMEAQQEAWAADPEYWSGQAFRRGVGIVTNAKETMRTHPAFESVRAFVDVIDWDTVVRIPFLVRERLTGWLVLYLPGGRPDERELVLFRALTDQASVAVENARLFDDVQNRTKQLTALYRADQELHRSLRLDDVLRALATVVADTLGADNAGMTNWPPDAPHPRLLVARHMAPATIAAIEDGVAADGRDDWDAPEDPDRVTAIEDTRTSPANVRLRTAELGILAIMDVPVFVGGQVFGALGAVWFQPRRFSEDEKQLMKALASRAALAIENAQLYEQSEDRARQLASLYRADEELHRSLKLDDVLNALLEVVTETMEADDTGLVLWQPGETRPRVMTARSNMRPDLIAQIEASFARQGRRVIKESRSVHDGVSLVEDSSKIAGPLAERTAAIGIGSLIETPLRVNGELFGVLDAVYRKPRTFTDEERRIFTALAKRASIAIENAQLYEQAQSLAAVEERQRLARELHDSVSQALYGIALGSRTARTLLERDPSRAIEPVDYVLSLAEAGLAEMRALIFELRPESLAEEGLVAAIDKQAASTRARYNIAVDATLPAEPDIPMPVKEAVYRVAQEALHNIVKHARATEVVLALDAADGALVLDLRDNGQGFDTTGEFPGHLGLRSMRERIERIGGTFSVESARGEGTRIRASVPLA